MEKSTRQKNVELLSTDISTVNGNWYIFQGGAGEKNFSAIIANEKVESLACGI
jgi:hypothetical protein